MSPESIIAMFGEALNHQVTQFGIAFTMAAWIHSGRVKKEIKAQGVILVASIDGLALALRTEISQQNDRITEHAKRIDGLSEKLEQLGLR